MLTGLLGANSAWSASSLRIGLLDIRGFTTRLPLQRLVARSYSAHPYTVPTYDNAFKDIMMNEMVRNSFFSAATHEPIESSVLLGLKTPNESSPEQLSIDSVGNFLEKYRPVIETYLETKQKAEKADAKTHKKVLTTHTLVDELARRFYEPLTHLFPSQKKQSILDFACKLKTGDMIFVETQVRPQDYWDRRALAYAARRYSGQLLKGEHWEGLKKVYSINILGGHEVSPSGERRYTWEDQQKTVHGAKTTPSFIKRYELTNSYDPSQHIPHLQIIQLYPQMFDQGSSDLSFLKEKNVPILAFVEWLNFFKDAHKRTEKEVEETVKDEGVKMAYSILKRHEPTQKYKDWCDLYGVKYADHIAQEAAEAKIQGEKTKALEFAQKLLNRGRPVEEIIEDTGLTGQEVEALKKPVR